MFVLGKRRRWEEPLLCLEQPGQEKSLGSSLREFLQGSWGELCDHAEKPVKDTVGRITAGSLCTSAFL